MADSSFELQVGNGDDARAHVAELAALYASDFVDPPLTGCDFYSADSFRKRMLDEYSLATGLKLITARSGESLVGFVYGCPLPEGSPWWSGVSPSLSAQFQAEDGTRTFAIIDLLVRRTYRGAGLARAMYQRLIEDRPESRITLLSSPPQVPAYDMWLHWGYETIGKITPGGDANELSCFVRPHR